MKVLIAIFVCGLLTSASVIASELHWRSNDANDVVKFMPPPESQQWYVKIRVYDNCGNTACGEIHINNCFMLHTLSAGKQEICKFADPKKPVTWNAVNNSKSAGEAIYIQF